jgi:hypothetical protein
MKRFHEFHGLKINCNIHKVSKHSHVRLSNTELTIPVNENPYYDFSISMEKEYLISPTGPTKGEFIYSLIYSNLIPISEFNTNDLEIRKFIDKLSDNDEKSDEIIKNLCSEIRNRQVNSLQLKTDSVLVLPAMFIWMYVKSIILHTSLLERDQLNIFILYPYKDYPTEVSVFQSDISRKSTICEDIQMTNISLNDLDEMKCLGQVSKNTNLWITPLLFNFHCHNLRMIRFWGDFIYNHSEINGYWILSVIDISHVLEHYPNLKVKRVGNTTISWSLGDFSINNLVCDFFSDIHAESKYKDYKMEKNSKDRDVSKLIGEKSIHKNISAIQTRYYMNMNMITTLLSCIGWSVKSIIKASDSIELVRNMFPQLNSSSKDDIDTLQYMKFIILKKQ